MDVQLYHFISESNRIEGILREPTNEEVVAHEEFLSLSSVGMTDLEDFVAVVAPGKPLRTEANMNVRVGSHRPPRGGKKLVKELEELLAEINSGLLSPYEAHLDYETLHPFMDGNGRSGRVLWAWMMLQAGEDPFALPFLHRWYYQSLDGGR